MKRILDAFNSSLSCPDEPKLFRWINRSVLDRGDVCVHLADLPAYTGAQDRVSGTFRRPVAWGAKAILNVARIGRFSSDRTVRAYARDIWKVGLVGG